MTELKPCPFCGSEVEIKPTIAGVDKDLYEWVIHCWNCDFKLKGHMCMKAKEVMENMWNQRAKE